MVSDYSGSEAPVWQHRPLRAAGALDGAAKPAPTSLRVGVLSSEGMEGLPQSILATFRRSFA
jgi:hypothetical protein